MSKFGNWLAKFGFKVLKPVGVSSTDTTKDVVFKIVRMYVGEAVRLEEGLLLADRSIFDDDDPSDIAGLLERSFRVLVPRSEFKNVYTVGDMIQLFERYRTKSMQPPPSTRTPSL